MSCWINYLIHSLQRLRSVVTEMDVPEYLILGHSISPSPGFIVHFFLSDAVKLKDI